MTVGFGAEMTPGFATAMTPGFSAAMTPGLSEATTWIRPPSANSGFQLNDDSVRIPVWDWSDVWAQPVIGHSPATKSAPASRSVFRF
jgi:hypothetical protein